MPANFKAELVACFGQPVEENPTGPMMEPAFQALGLNWRYLTVEVAPDKLRDAILGRGPNPVTPAGAVAVMQVLEQARESIASRANRP